MERSNSSIFPLIASAAAVVVLAALSPHRAAADWPPGSVRMGRLGYNLRQVGRVLPGSSNRKRIRNSMIRQWRVDE